MASGRPVCARRRAPAPGAVPARLVRQDNYCAFGKWLYGDGKATFPSREQHEEVRTRHAEFHREAARVLDMALAGKVQEATAALAMGSQFNRVSATLVTKLNVARAAVVGGRSAREATG